MNLLTPVMCFGVVSDIFHPDFQTRDVAQGLEIYMALSLQKMGRQKVWRRIGWKT